MSFEKRPSDMSDFALSTNLGLAKLPPTFWRHVLFLPTWTEFENDPTKGEAFRKLTTKERKEFLQPFVAVEMPATREMPWVWTGEYSAPRYLPMFNDKSVPRLLYKHFVNPTLPDNRRLKPQVRDLSNVNPYRYFPACGQQYFEKPKKISSALHTQLVLELTKEIRDDWGVDDLEYVREKLKDKYPLNILDEAIRNLS